MAIRSASVESGLKRLEFRIKVVLEQKPIGIHQMLQKYTVAKDFAGLGTKTFRRKINGEWKEVELTLLEQQLEKCPT